jgi:hypothetical protein
MVKNTLINITLAVSCIEESFPTSKGSSAGITYQVIVFRLTRLGIKPTIYRMEGKLATVTRYLLHHRGN